jgi:hypothetical protein
MPNRILPIKATYESVTRLATHSVVEQVMKRTGLSPNVSIRYPGETGNDFQPGSAITGEDENKFEHSNKVLITVQEEYKEDAIINTPVRYNDSPYIFEDKDIGVVLKPVYSYTSVTINFAIRFGTRVESEAWLNDIKVRLGVNRSTMLHELDYHYEVPQLALNVLAHLHELREAQAGYGQDLVSWFREKFTKRTTTLSNASGNSSLMVIGEKAIGVQGWFEFVEPPPADKDDAGASWTATFTYRFNYQKPVSINFIYPIIVHNQQIDGRLFSKVPPYSLADRPSLKTETLQSYDTHSELYRLPPDPMGGKRHPVWDDWIPLSIPNYTASLASWMLQVDKDDPSFVMNMDQLGSDELVPVIRDFMISEAPYIAKRGESLLYFTLFCGKVPMDDGSITLDADLNLRTTAPMDLRQTYHIRLAVITELSILSKRAIRALQENGYATLLIWQSLFPSLDVEYAVSRMPVDGYLSTKYLEWFFQMLRDKNVGNTMPNSTGGSFNQPVGEYYENYFIEWPLVSILTIIAAKKKD